MDMWISAFLRNDPGNLAEFTKNRNGNQSRWNFFRLISTSSIWEWRPSPTLWRNEQTFSTEAANIGKTFFHLSSQVRWMFKSANRVSKASKLSATLNWKSFRWLEMQNSKLLAAFLHLFVSLLLLLLFLRLLSSGISLWLLLLLLSAGRCSWAWLQLTWATGLVLLWFLVIILLLLTVLFGKEAHNSHRKWRSSLHINWMPWGLGRTAAAVIHFDVQPSHRQTRWHWHPFRGAWGFRTRHGSALTRGKKKPFERFAGEPRSAMKELIDQNESWKSMERICRIRMEGKLKWKGMHGNTSKDECETWASLAAAELRVPLI